MPVQVLMQANVGIVRNEAEMEHAIEGIHELRVRAERSAVSGNREYNSGWHTALDLSSLLTVSEAVARAALSRRESRGAHFREDCPEKDAAAGQLNTLIKKGEDGPSAYVGLFIIFTDVADYLNAAQITEILGSHVGDGARSGERKARVLLCARTR